MSYLGHEEMIKINKGLPGALERLHSEYGWRTEDKVRDGAYEGHLLLIATPSKSLWRDPTFGNVRSASTLSRIIDTKLRFAALDPRKPASIFYHDEDHEDAHGHHDPIYPGVVSWDYVHLFAGMTGYKGIVDHTAMSMLGFFGRAMSETLYERMIDPTEIPQLAAMIKELDLDFGQFLKDMQAIIEPRVEALRS